jgi:hypothetical protein
MSVKYLNVVLVPGRVMDATPNFQGPIKILVNVSLKNEEFAEMNGVCRKSGSLVICVASHR